MTLSMAGNFNPAQKMFIPAAGVDYSAYLGANPGTYGFNVPQLSFPTNTIGAISNPIINPMLNRVGLGNGYYYNPLQMRGESLKLNRNIKNLYNSISCGEADRVETDFSAFKSSYMQTAEYKMLTRGLTDVDDKMVAELVAEKYRNTTGIDLAEHIDDGVRGNFTAGLWNGMTLGIGQFKSNDDVKNELLGENISTGAKIAKTTGSVAGGAATGAAIGAGIGVWFGGVGAGPGAAIGAGVGAVCGLISRLWS